MEEKKDRVIDISKLTTNSAKRLEPGLIAPAKEIVHSELAEEHSAEPIKNIEDIYMISDFLIYNKRWRDNMLFIVGINFGLRASDLRMLRFSDLINDNLTFKETFAVFEKKTRNTRKRKKNRYITINRAVIEAVTLFLEQTPGVSLSDYMFRSFSNNSKEKNEPISVRSIERILKGIAYDLGLNIRMSTHTLRKTFCYHQMVISNNDSRKLMLLCQMLGHSTPAQTLTYIGITAEEISAAYKELNLGSHEHDYLVESDFYEVDNAVESVASAAFLA